MFINSCCCVFINLHVSHASFSCTQCFMYKGDSFTNICRRHANMKVVVGSTIVCLLFTLFSSTSSYCIPVSLSFLRTLRVIIKFSLQAPPPPPQPCGCAPPSPPACLKLHIPLPPAPKRKYWRLHTKSNP